MTDRRFIEESFPVKEVGEISAKEKSIRHGHISTLHIWWARRPLAASRATAYAALTPAPTNIEEWQKKRDFIIELSKWENSNNQQLLERARQDILDANGGVPPKVLDPFSGGGSYPLEAMRLGCETYANDYNPVAVLIEKATLEYPQKFRRPFEGMPEWAKGTGLGDKGTRNNRKEKKGKETQASLFDQTTYSQVTESQSTNPLLNAVRYWGEWVLEEARKELAGFYPPDLDGSIPVAYIWARTIPCQNPSCGIEIPLMRQFWLVKKDKKKVSLYPDIENGKLNFRIIGDGYNDWVDEFDPENGTVSRAVVICPLCGTVLDADTTRRLFNEKQNKQKLIAVMLTSQHGKTKKYRLASEKDEIIYQKAISELETVSKNLTAEWGISPIPDEPIKRVPVAFGVINVWVYGINNWGMLFNDRQTLALITFAQKVREAYSKIIEMGGTSDFASAVATYLALTVSRMSDFESNLCHWHPQWEFISHTFSRQALPMGWDYAELNLLSPILTGTFDSMFGQVLDVIDVGAAIENPVHATTNTSAIQLPYPENYFDSILMDPPYYDNVPYSYISDFFYIWLKRILGNVYPDLFSTPLTPKSGEIVAYAQKEGDYESGYKYFEQSIKKSLQEVFRVLKENGIAVVVYAHKSTAGWETLINSFLDSKLVVSSAWPINTEMQTRMRAIESATLASSIYIVARKSLRQPTGFYNDVRQELRSHLDTKLNRLWGEGIGGADFFIAAIGSAIEVFGKYEQVMDYEGNIVRADRLLDEVRTIATDYAVRQILHNGFATEISDLSRLYVLWRWNYCEALVPFDEGRKLAQSCGIDLSQQWGKNGFIKKEKGFIRLLGPQNRKLDDLDDPRDMIDVLHKALLLWEQSKRPEMIQTLAENGHGSSEAFYRVAQAISETLPNESKEKKLLDGFLAGRERVQQEVEKVAGQGRLWE